VSKLIPFPMDVYISFTLTHKPINPLSKEKGEIMLKQKKG